MCALAVDHPGRSAALAELHARPAPEISIPSRIVRIILQPSPGSTQSSHDLVKQICIDNNAPQPLPSDRYHSVALEGIALRWEQHTEFATFTVIENNPSASDSRALLHAKAVLDLASGQQLLIAGISLNVRAQQTTPQETSATHCVSRIAGGRAILETDFQANSDGLVEFELSQTDLLPAECGVFAQRILELETYRMLALMALPLARSVGMQVQTLEGELKFLIGQIQAQDREISPDALFAGLSQLAARIEAQIAATTYRFAAAGAYGAIVQDRLQSLHELPAGNNPQAGRFLMTRLTPALRTCTSMQAALADLALRCARASDLMRTRIDLQLAKQNNQLLTALNERTRLQMRLQQTVEGLSIAAISYYLAGLLLYVVKGAKSAKVLTMAPEIIVAFALPFIVAVVGWIVFRIRNAHRPLG